jgi:hypothetical protein
VLCNLLRIVFPVSFNKGLIFPDNLLELSIPSLPPHHRLLGNLKRPGLHLIPPHPLHPLLHLSPLPLELPPTLPALLLLNPQQLRQLCVVVLELLDFGVFLGEFFGELVDAKLIILVLAVGFAQLGLHDAEGLLVCGLEAGFTEATDARF